ncbi:type IV pilus modification PilV family protein [Sulfurospirillum multivorans]|uniref:Uncharacterized protein n=2 Tax=Sulfurospirillum multivorans TaxID=66821 RepID=A0AA86AMV3_SULMK|nr:hypothetical protein [Sulfurospirillum multivorans]AHJ12358.1 hypothetical protein SMUL_1092 [Sulfurospirillum multivorans DSM 12446]QEH05856.1 hypothetical protein SMN_1082 [Sulfurospirillum multivorans]
MTRSAMSMIELVFAIVIMGIAVMSLPLILTQVQSNNAFAMQQEAILAAKAKIGDMLTYEWDANSFNAATQRSYVLDAINGNFLLRRVGATNMRLGHVQAESRRKFPDAIIFASAIGADVTVPLIVNAGENAGALDYVFTLNLTTSVNYAEDNATYSNTPLNDFTFNPDNAPATPTNIKVISVTVSGGEQNITLRAFTCNIGESTLLPSRPYR